MPALSASELTDLANQLESEPERQKLISNLRALAVARDADATKSGAKAEDDPGAAIVDGVLDQMRQAGSAFAALGALFADLPAIANWAERQVSEPRLRALWTDVLLKLGAAFLTAATLHLLARWAIRRPLSALKPVRQEGRAPASAWLQLVLALLRALVALVPITVFAATAYGTLALLAPNALTRDLAQIVVLAFVMQHGLGVAADMLLSHGKAPRLLRMDEESAHYALVWLKRLGAVSIIGYAIVRIALRIHVPPDGVDAIAKLAGFIVAALLSVLILQVRHLVAARIRGDHLPPAPETPSIARNAAHGASWRVLRQRLGYVWHILALLYVAAIYLVWALAIEGGFTVFLRGTLLTVVILFVARLLRLAIDQGFVQLFAISADMRQRFPSLEARANRYMPLLTGMVRAALFALALFAILQAWGFDVVGWFASDFGRSIVARMVTILLVLLITVALWEGIASFIEYYLTRPGPDGRPTQRSGRARTLLPLLRRTVSIVLAVIAGLIVLSELGINIAPLLAGAGVVGLAVGFGAQTLVKDVITGIFILTEDTISIGDIVDLGGNGGVVEDISIRTIRLRDGEGIVHVIPYSEVTKIKNMTRGYAQAMFIIRVSYQADIDEVFAVLYKLGEEFRAEPEWNARILAPFEMWGVDELGESYVTIRARFKTLPAQQWSVKREFQKRIKQRFDKLGIPFGMPSQRAYIAGRPAGGAPPPDIQSETQPSPSP